MNDAFFYLATPYSAYPGGLDSAFLLACKQAANLMEAGWKVFSPIAHYHPIASFLPHDKEDQDFWVSQSKPFILASAGIILVTAEGWESSAGMQMEKEIFITLEKPIYWMVPNYLPVKEK